MSLFIPAKTFILGEYAALQGYSGILLNTQPCFEVSLINNVSDEENLLQGIHPNSPAGQFWALHGLDGMGLKFHDPYGGLGGLGASSAQFLGAYLYAFGLAQNDKIDLQHLLNLYETFTWNGHGPRPSGYDVLAQLTGSCVFISKQPFQVEPLTWSFEDVKCLLVHTGVKCVTHTHLHQLELPVDLANLGALVIEAKQAIENKQVQWLSDCINAYEAQLRHYGWVTQSTQAWVDQIKHYPGVLATKGCGAMGSDVIFILVKTQALSGCASNLAKLGLKIINR
jgi:mevalonate kinase